MAHCAAVDIANALVSQYQTAEAAGEFSVEFTCRASLGDFAEKLEGDGLDKVVVDVVPPVRPSIEVSGRSRYRNGVTMTVGVRKKLGSGHCNPDGSYRLDSLAPLLDLYYELLEYLMPSTDNPQGRRVTTDDWAATFFGPVEVVKLWDPNLLEQAKQYCGIFRMPFVVTKEA